MATLISNQLRIKFIPTLLFRFIFNQELFMSFQKREGHITENLSTWQLSLVRKKDLTLVGGKLDKNKQCQRLAIFALHVNYRVDVGVLDCNWRLWSFEKSGDENWKKTLESLFESREKVLYGIYPLIESEVITFAGIKGDNFITEIGLTKLKSRFYRVIEAFRNHSDYEWIISSSEYVDEPLTNSTTTTTTLVSSDFCTQLHPLTNATNLRNVSSKMTKRLAKDAQVVYDFRTHAMAANRIVFAKYFSPCLEGEKISKTMLEYVMNALGQLRVISFHVKDLETLPRIIDKIQTNAHSIRLTSMQARLNDILDDASPSNAFIIAATTPPPVVTPRLVDFGKLLWSPTSVWKNVCFYPVNGDGKQLANPMVKHQLVVSINSFQIHGATYKTYFLQFKKIIRLFGGVYNLHFSIV